MTTVDTSEADQRIVNGVRAIIAKAMPTEQPQRTRPGGMDFGWGGGGQPLVTANTDPILLEVPFNARIVWAHLWALDGAGAVTPVTATVEVRIRTTQGSGGSSVLYGTGSVPALTSAGFADLDLTGWQRNLVIGDAVIARLTALTGSANLVALTLQLRPTEVPVGVTPLIDAGASTYVDANGNPYVYRS